MKGRKGLAKLLAQLDPDDDLLKGTQFEHICKWFLENDPRYGHLTQVWMWNDWPGNWGSDAGIDLVAQDRDGLLWAIQAKAYDEKYWIKKRDVDKFLSESGRPQISYRLLIGTTDRIMHRAEKTLNEQAVPSAFFGLSKLEAAQVNWPDSLSDLLPPPLPPKEPRLGQQQSDAACV